MEDLQLKLLLTRSNVATLHNPFLKGEAIRNNRVARGEVDVLVQVEIALSRLNAIVFDKINRCAFAINGNGGLQRVVVQNNGVISDCRNIFLIRVLRINVNQTNPERSVAARRIHTGKLNFRATIDGEVASCPNGRILGRHSLNAAAVD